MSEFDWHYPDIEPMPVPFPWRRIAFALVIAAISIIGCFVVVLVG